MRQAFVFLILVMSIMIQFLVSYILDVNYVKNRKFEIYSSALVFILIFFFCAVRYSFPYKKMVPVHPSFVKFILFTIFLFILFIMFIIFIMTMFREKMAPVQPSFIMFSVKPQGSEAVSVRVVACSVCFFISVVFLFQFCLFPCCRISRIWMDLGTKATPMWRWDLEIH